MVPAGKGDTSECKAICRLPMAYTEDDQGPRPHDEEQAASNPVCMPALGDTYDDVAGKDGFDVLRMCSVTTLSQSSALCAVSPTSQVFNAFPRLTSLCPAFGQSDN